MHEVLINRLGGLSLPRKSVVRLTDRPDMTLDVYRGRKTSMQQMQHKHLGLTLNNKVRWHDHIQNIIKSANKVICVMRRLKFTLSRAALNQIYLAYVRPILEYSSIVWDGCTIQDLNSLEKLKNEAARLVTGLTRSVSLEKLYKECAWAPLSERKQFQKLCFMYKCNYNIVPDYISDLIPPLEGEVSNYPLRNANDFTTPRTRTETFRKSVSLQLLPCGTA